ncbi:MAG: DinB family protein [Heyndrickxia sp.]
MKEENANIIKQYREYSKWVSGLASTEKSIWHTPISPGKWTIGEIISHITNWDNYLLTQIIPSVKRGQGMVFPDFDSFNKKASEYALSGISYSDLIQEAINTRVSLCNNLLQLSEEDLCMPLTSNGVSHCPHTGEPYSLLYIIKEFIQHDQHHKDQITHYLSRLSYM